jgi:thiol-disulfide isomerase/thioredoxin
MRSRGLGSLAIVFVLLSSARSGFAHSGAQRGKSSAGIAQKSLAAETKASTKRPVFEPLEKWKAAVLAGDLAALSGLYSTSPPAVTITREGKTTDPAAEPQFWSGLKGSGLASMKVNILEITSPGPGVQGFNLHIEATVISSAGRTQLVCSAMQYWTNTDGGWRIIGTKRGRLAPPAIPPRLPQPGLTNPHLYPEPEGAATDLAAALSAAAKEHKRVLVVFGANWCYDCHVLDATFHSKELAPLVAANYKVVHINVGEMDKNLDIVQRYQVPIQKGIPALVVLDSDGKLVFSQRQGEFENSYKIGISDVTDFLNRWKPSARN